MSLFSDGRVKNSDMSYLRNCREKLDRVSFDTQDRHKESEVQMKRVAYYITEVQKNFLEIESNRTGLSQCELIRRYIDVAREIYDSEVFKPIKPEAGQEDTCQEKE